MPEEEEPHRPVALTLPLTGLIRCALSIWTLKALSQSYFGLKKRIDFLRPASSRATYTKVYPQRPWITNRVFIPPSYKPGDALLPLYIDIHGGGFSIGDPILDDPDNLILSHSHGICIVSIGYRLAPRSPFPGPVEDVAALVEAVLADPDLPVDKSKVAIGGYSAGGNLCLAAPQLRGLSKAIKAAVAYYPVVDFSRSGLQKMAALAPSAEPDALLKRMGDAFNWAYVPKHADVKNPLLSPIFAERDKLPEKVFLIGCEHDLLCDEDERMANRLAEEDGSEKKYEKEGVAWQTRNVRWEKIMGHDHGFNQKPGGNQKVKQARTKAMHAAVAKWLFEEVYV